MCVREWEEKKRENNLYNSRWYSICDNVKNANAFDSNQTNQQRSKKNKNTYARIVALFRFICDSNAIAHSNPSIIIERDTYTESYISIYIYKPMHTIEPDHHSYLKRRHSLLYTTRNHIFTVSLLHLFRFDSIFTSYVRTFVGCHSMGCSQPYGCTKTVMACAHTYVGECIQMCDDVGSRTCVCVSVPACV